MPSGKIVKKSDKGFGFIQPDDRSKDIFFHVTGLNNRAEFDGLTEGTPVEYEVDDSGERPRAINIEKK